MQLVSLRRDLPSRRITLEASRSCRAVADSWLLLPVHSDTLWRRPGLAGSADILWLRTFAEMVTSAPDGRTQEKTINGNFLLRVCSVLFLVKAPQFNEQGKKNAFFSSINHKNILNQCQEKSSVLNNIFSYKWIIVTQFRSCICIDEYMYRSSLFQQDDLLAIIFYRFYLVSLSLLKACAAPRGLSFPLVTTTLAVSRRRADDGKTRLTIALPPSHDRRRIPRGKTSQPTEQ